VSAINCLACGISSGSRDQRSQESHLAADHLAPYADIVQGTDSVQAIGNVVQGSRWGGMVFDNVNQYGVIENNQFISNNTSGYGPYCNGVNFKGTVSVTMSGNTVDSGNLTCYPWGP
jgi:hypothetical protein